LLIIIRIKLGNPIFYKGTRLGINKNPFDIYKFRTLPTNAQSIVGTELLSTKHQLTTPFTEFIRDTRLDELPQLFNVIKGDMNFIGPRPERPEVYEAFCQKIPNYDKRFMVKPGVMGYSQLFTPHSTPKKLRTLVDNSYLKHPPSTLMTLKLVSYTGYVVLKRIFTKAQFKLEDLWQRKILKRYNEKRRKHRRPMRSIVQVSCKGKLVAEGVLINMNQEAFLVYTNNALPKGSNEDDFLYTFTVPNIKKTITHHTPYKTAKCTGYIVKEKMIKNEKYKYSYVIFYEPLSPFNDYLIDQYVMHSSLAF
jgi:lipopolysaccharide/colanic/teichoic acid biosynthesis glycosyltransferase